MNYLPLTVHLNGAKVLLVGGGNVAARKARLLLAAGANLTVVAPELSEEMNSQLGDKCQWLQRDYQSADIAGKRLVVAATDDEALNAQVAADAEGNNILVNVVDCPELCSFIFPAIVDRSPVTVAISSSGCSPVLARDLRRQVEAMLPANYGRLAEFVAAARSAVKTRLADESARRLFLEELVAGPVAELVLAGREEEAGDLLQSLLGQTQDEGGKGAVYLIGAGPGDPDLMTFKALRLLQCADVVLYDRLVSAPILELSRRDAQRIYVGKARSNHSLPQQDINELLLKLALEGKQVARLKGGDPFIFGRGGEEIDLLAQHQIPFQVVPGITAASGAACYAGIPLTHRDYAQSVRFVAGYLKGDRIEHDWPSLCRPDETLVFYMGLVGLDIICKQLIAHGRKADTAIAVVERATLDDQRVVIGELSSIATKVKREALKGPTLIIVGEVVRLQQTLAWYGPQ